MVDPKTVSILLKAPSSPFLAQLTDRAGMIVSPKAAEAAGKNFGTKPVCAGPFRFVERVAQDRIVLERFPGYWNAAADPPRRASPTSRSRTARSGSPTCRPAQLEMVQTIVPNDVKAVQRNPKLKVVA